MASVVAMPEVEKKSSNAGGREKFMEVYKQLKKELLSDSELVTYTDESRAWVEEVSEFRFGSEILCIVNQFYSTRKRAQRLIFEDFHCTFWFLLITIFAFVERSLFSHREVLKTRFQSV